MSDSCDQPQKKPRISVDNNGVNDDTDQTISLNDHSKTSEHVDNNGNQQNECSTPHLSFKDEHFKLLEETIASCSALGSCLIVGIDRDDSDSTESSSSDEDEELTEEQVLSLRRIIITENREKALRRATKFATGGQRGCMMFNTDSGNMLIAELPREIRKAMKKVSLPDQFDALFGLTYSIYQYDYWMTDNEMYGPGGNVIFGFYPCLVFLIFYS